MLVGETIALVVAVSWTATALFAEEGSKRMGSLPFNAVRMTLSLLLLIPTLWLIIGAPYPRFADTQTWLWLLLSGVVGYTIGDYCLMKGYIIIGSRFGQLFMTLSAPTAALFGRLLLGESMRPLALVGMAVTVFGIALSILAKPHDGHLSLKLPAKGIFFAVMAGICQGAGLVLSKKGLIHYSDSIASEGLDISAAVPDAIVPLPLNVSITFASTMIRGSIGLAGFLLLLMIFGKDWRGQLRRAVTDRRAMRAAALSMLFGPFVGVSLSLLATLYTSTGVAQTIFALTPVLIIIPSVMMFHQKVTVREVAGALISVLGVSLFFM